MVSKKLMWTTIFKTNFQPFVVIDMLLDLWTGSFTAVLVEVSLIGARSGVGIDALADMSSDVLISELIGIGIDILIGVGIVVAVASAVTALEFAVSVLYAVGVFIDALTPV